MKNPHVISRKICLNVYVIFPPLSPFAVFNLGCVFLYVILHTHEIIAFFMDIFYLKTRVTLLSVFLKKIKTS